MSSATQTPCSGLGIFQNMFHAPNFAATAVQAPDEIMRGFARWQLELQGLMFRRAQAYLELPSRMSQCRSPQDLMAEQQRFFQTCMQQYSETSQQIMCAWAQILQGPSVAGSAKNAAPKHDYLAFPEPRAANGVGKSQPQHETSDRKVA